MRPNILMITCDQLRKDALGCYDNQVISTPNIDKIALSGTICNEMYVTCPVCAPNRAAIATGRFPSINGVPQNSCILPKNETTLMETLRRIGYSTYGIGKMHFGPQWEFKSGEYKAANNYNGGYGAVNPQPYPWDFPFYGFEKGAFSEDNRVGPYEDFLKEHGLSAWDDPHSFTYGQQATISSTWPEKYHQTTWVADKAVDYLEQHLKEKPFFMWISFIHPHSPFNPPAPYDTMYSPAQMPLPIRCEQEIDKWPEVYRRNYFSKDTHHGGVSYSEFKDSDWQKIKAYYYGMISLIDKQVGKIMDTIKRRNMLKNTIIVFTSDHGEMMGDHNLLLKGTHYDCVTNVPFIINVPYKSFKNKKWKGLSQSIDIMPTLLELAGTDIPEGVQGKSLVSALNGSEIKLYDNVFIENSGGKIRTLRTPEWQLTWHGVDTTGELYDLTNDHDCLNNLWNNTKFNKIKCQLINKLIERLVMNVDPLMKRHALC